MRIKERDIQQASAWNLDASTYASHALHTQARNFVEGNCYIDIWIELIHARGLDPYAFLPFTLASDFEGDQWTFYKPSFDDLSYLYGINVQELYLWRSLPEQVATQLRLNKIVLLEADSFYLPDTRGSDYQQQHVKTTIGIESIDIDSCTLGYFHNEGYNSLQGEDFRGIFHLEKAVAPESLPPYAEIVKFDSIVHYPHEEIRQRSMQLAQRYSCALPTENPISCFSQVIQSDVEWLMGQGLDVYHRYAFGSLRQMGSCFELTAHYCRWLQGVETEPTLSEIAAHFDDISQIAKALILKGARMVNRQKSKDLSTDLEDAADHWDIAMSALQKWIA